MTPQLFNEDCLDALKKIEDKSVDLICVDPPYCIGVSSNGQKSTFTDFNLMKPFFETLFKEFVRVSKEGAHIYFFTDWWTYPFLYPLLKQFLNVRNLIVWDYQKLKAGNFYRFSHELIIFATREGAKRNFAASERDVWRIPHINYTSAKKLHQAQKPVDLITKIIQNSSKKNDTVLDCFMGSGTTGVVCKRTGRNFIGIEIDPSIFDVAKKRIENSNKTYPVE